MPPVFLSSPSKTSRDWIWTPHITLSCRQFLAPLSDFRFYLLFRNHHSSVSQSMFTQDQPGPSSSTTSEKGKQRAFTMTGRSSSHGPLVNTPLEESVWPPARESERWTASASDLWRQSRERAKTDRDSWDYGEWALYLVGLALTQCSLKQWYSRRYSGLRGMYLGHISVTRLIWFFDRPKHPLLP